LLQLAKSFHGVANIVKPLSAFRHQARHGFAVPSNEDVLTL
jgi:hypothetical protein